MDLASMVSSGAPNPIFLFGTALALGALHGLEPGHSKTMIAAFVIAVRGTVPQAILLGLSAATSHSIIVWVLALIALAYGDELIAEQTESYFMLTSGLIVIGVGIWMFYHNYPRQVGPLKKQVADSQNHNHEHHHSYGNEDAHASFHAQQIKEQFKDGKATTGQVVLFGLTGGLIPCPAAITVLIICLYLQKFWLGITIVGAFSIGLACTLVAVGAFAALSVNYASKRYSGFNTFMTKAPYISSLLIIAVGGLMVFASIQHI
ncbi:MAG TPA: nickel/cobalt efflux transporter [Nitrospinota bacterium]|nr:nickel/cobalt efflux transporter [Nitrospinota bacterium]|tara:strand:- start:134115 stop:134900 length:786 start_codon:yes stop_codon:yes gene_type:complete